jgi:hypothetical protein
VSNWTQENLCRALADIARIHPEITDPDIQARMINRNNGWEPPVNVADIIQARRENEAESQAAAERKSADLVAKTGT